MAIVTFDRKTFEREIGKLTEEMQNKIAMFGTPLEEFDDKEIQIEVFPNRPDLLSYQGFKRSFIAFLGKKTGLVNYKVHKPEKNYSVNIDSSVKEIRPYTACAIVRGLKLSDVRIKELIEIQEKLHVTVGRKRKKVAIGIYPLDKIKLPITYKAMEPDKIRFVPLEGSKEMSGLQILQKHPTGKEYAHLLSGKIKFPLFVDSEDKIMSMPPIINSNLTGRVTEKTKDVFVECSGYDESILKKCLNIIVTSLADMGGKIYQVNIKGSRKDLTPNLSSEKMKLSLENTNKLLGLELTEKQIKKLAEKMGYDYSGGQVKIPSWRTDILHEVDLIEDIAISYGYENFVPEIPNTSTTGLEEKNAIVKRKISEILTGLNMLEVSNYHLTNKKDQMENMDLQKKLEKNIIELSESKTEYNLLRADLSHYLVKNLANNVDSEYPHRIFESGKVFTYLPERDKICESENLAIAISPGNFTEIKQICNYLFSMLGLEIKISEPKEKPYPYFIDGRVACLKDSTSGNSIGFMGEVHPKILRNWKIKMPVAILEINLEEIFSKFN